MATLFDVATMFPHPFLFITDVFPPSVLPWNPGTSDGKPTPGQLTVDAVTRQSTKVPEV